MIIAAPLLTSLAQQCAPAVATEAMLPLIATESGGDPLSLHVNKGPLVRAHSVTEGAALVRRYVTAGYTVDVGLAQVNSANFARLGITVEQAFDPCTNLRAAATVLQEGFGLASRHYSGLDAISATYSLYNTGTLTRGFGNGYVGRIWSAAAAQGAIDHAPPLPASGTQKADQTIPGADSWVIGQIPADTVEVFR